MKVYKQTLKKEEKRGTLREHYYLYSSLGTFSVISEQYKLSPKTSSVLYNPSKADYTHFSKDKKAREKASVEILNIPRENLKKLSDIVWELTCLHNNFKVKNYELNKKLKKAVEEIE